MDISLLKTELSKRIEVCSDYQMLYNTYYVITSDKVKTHSKELFESRGLSLDSADFDYFVNNIAYDPNSGRAVEDTIAMIKDMRDGKLISQDFLDSSYQHTVSLRDDVCGRVSDDTLTKLLNYIPTSFSSSSVGKGEYAFVLLAEGASKPKKGGDLQLHGEDIEIKGPGAKMASQSTHIPMSAMRREVIDYLYDEYHDGPFNIFPLTNKHIQTFYYEHFGRDWIRVLQFVRFVFLKSMKHLNSEDLDWINESLIVDDQFDYFAFLEKMAIFEFTYYKTHDSFDRILFVNPTNFHMMNTNEMNEDLIKSFTLSRSYSFSGERIQTNYFTLK